MRPGAQVGAMVNIADVFELFGEMAGIDVHQVVPPSRPIDSVAMLPYLDEPEPEEPAQDQLHADAPNLKAAGYVVPPCVVPSVNTCVQLFPQQALCASEGGVWWGRPTPPSIRRPPVGAGAPQPDCCSVNKYNLTQSAAGRVHRAARLADGDARRRLQARALSTTDYDPTTDSA